MSETQPRWGGPGEDYRLKKIRTTEAELFGPDDPAPAQAPTWRIPQRVRSLPFLEIIFTILGTVGVIVLMVTYVRTGGVVSAAVMTALALIPLVIVLGVLSYLDRWEREGWKSNFICFIWGAGVATLSSLVVNSTLNLDIARTLGDQDSAVVIVAVFVAPVAEEFFKGIGVIIFILARRNSINSRLDGLICGGIVGAGFAFIENIQYFLRTSSSGAFMLTTTVFTRGILSPFVHPMATSFTGMAIALVLIRRYGALWSTIRVFLGYLTAVFFHGLWNFLASNNGIGGWFHSYITIEVPLFTCWFIYLITQSSREAKHIQQGLTPYVVQGWVLPVELQMVTDRAQRRNAVKWAASAGSEARKAMNFFLNSLAAIGLDEYARPLRKREDPARDAYDRELLTKAVEARKKFLSLTELSQAARRVGA